MPLDDLVDVITQDILQDPVIAEDGYTYSRKSLLWWFSSCAERGVEITSPITGDLMGSSISNNDHADQYLEEMEERLAPYRRSSPLRALEMQHPIASIKVLANMFRYVDALDLASEEEVLYVPPKIVVIGDHWCGKSALLERITMLSCFPIGDDLCTALPIHVHLRNATSECPTIATLSVIDSSNGKPAGPTEVIPCIDSASWYVHDAVRKLVGEHADDQQYAKTICSTRHILIQIQSPYIPSIDIIELPSITGLDPSSEVRQRIEHYIKANPHAFYLVVVDAKSDLEQSPALELVQKFHVTLTGVGVITKCDRISSRRLREVKAFLASVQSFNTLSHGFVCTMNPMEKRRRGEQQQQVEEEIDIHLDDDMSSLTCQSMSERAPSDKKIETDVVNHENHGDNGLIIVTERTARMSDNHQISLFVNDCSNYGRLIRQSQKELIWFKTHDCNDLLASRRAGTPSVISVFYELYVTHMKKNWVPQTLLRLLGKRKSLLEEDAALGTPAIPLDVDIEYKGDETMLWDKVHEQIATRVREVLLASERDIFRLYAQDILHPLLEGVARTSVEDVELEFCLSDKYHVETFLAKLRSDVGSICQKSIDKTKVFWGRAVAAALRAESTDMHLSRFDSWLEFIAESIDKEALQKLAGVKSDMESCVLRHLSAANSSGGVTVHYSFTYELDALLTFDAHELSNTLVFVLSRQSRLMCIIDIVEVVMRCLDHFVHERLLAECCSVDRYLIRIQLYGIERAVHALLSSSSELSLPGDEDDEGYTRTTPLLANLKNAGLDAKMLKAAGFTVQQLKEGGFNARDLTGADISAIQMYSGGYDIPALRDCGASISMLTNQLLFEGVPFDELVTKGVSYCELKESGYNLIDMMDDASDYVQTRLLTTLKLLRLSQEEGARIIESGDIFSLIRHLKDDDMGLRSAALSLLTGVVSQNAIDNELVEVFLLTETVGILCNMISSDDPSIVEGAMTILGRISYNADVQSTISDQTAFDTVLHCVRNGTQECRGNAVVVIAAVAANHIRELVERGILGVVMEIIDFTTNTVGMTSSLSLLRTIYQDPIGDSIVLTATNMQAISSVLLHDDEACVESALEVLIALCKYGSYRDKFVGHGVVGNIIQVLSKCQRVQCKRYCVEMLHCISRNSAHRSALLATDTVEVLQKVMSPQLSWEMNVWICAILKSLSKEGKSAKISIVQSGVGAKIVSLLDPSQSEAVRESAANIISTLAGEATNCDALAAVGCIEPLVELLYCTHEGCKESTASALKSLAYSEKNRIAIAEAGAVDPLISMMRFNISSCKVMAARALRNLSFNCKDNKIAIANLGGIEVLIGMLKLPDANIQAAAAGVLQNLSYRSTANQFAMVTGGAVEELVEVMKSGKDGPCQEACGVLRNLTVDPGNSTALMRAGVAPMLVIELDCAVKVRREVAAEALRNLCAANVSHRIQVKSMGITAEDIRYKDKW